MQCHGRVFSVRCQIDNNLSSAHAFTVESKVAAKRMTAPSFRATVLCLIEGSSETRRYYAERKVN
eukprot:2785029-Pleurochrysis_carterae.AAC.3